MPRGLKRWLVTRDPSWLRFGPLGSTAFLVIGCVLIGTWQLSYAGDPSKIDDTYQRAPGQRGIYSRQLPRFLYFFHYTGKFPITMRAQKAVLRDDPAEARRLLSIPNPYLMNEDYAVIRSGDLGKIFLLIPDLLRVDSPLRTTLFTFNRMIGIGSLLCLFVALSLLERRLLATVLVGLFGSNPFQLYHLYVPPENIWAYPMCVASVALALNAPLFFARKPSRAAFALPVVSGLLLASVREVRTEPALVAASLLVAYAIAPRMGWRGRVALVATFAVTAMLASMAWTRYWDHKITEATEIVRRAGGKPFPELANLHHALWHPIWWGLGDLAAEKGYHSSDRAVYAYAIPLMNERFGTNYERRRKSFELQNRHPESGYRIKPETLPEYTTVLRDKVIGDVTADPLWYASILAKRSQRAFDAATPIRFGFANHFVDIPFSAWFAIPVLGFALVARRWDQVALLLFYTTTSLPTVLISSRPGFDHIASFHMATFAVVSCWAVNAASDVLAAKRSAAR